MEVPEYVDSIEYSYGTTPVAVAKRLSDTRREGMGTTRLELVRATFAPHVDDGDNGYKIYLQLYPHNKLLHSCRSIRLGQSTAGKHFAWTLHVLPDQGAFDAFANDLEELSAQMGLFRALRSGYEITRTLMVKGAVLNGDILEEQGKVRFIKDSFNASRKAVEAVHPLIADQAPSMCEATYRHGGPDIDTFKIGLNKQDGSIHFWALHRLPAIIL